MSSFEFNEIGFQRFINDPNGAVARDLLRRGNQVKDIAYANVSGDVLNVDTGNLRGHLEAILEPGRDGIEVHVGTTAIDPVTQFGYPRYYDRLASGQARQINSFMPSRPWLRSALRQVFP